MNTDKIIPIGFSRNITPFVVGDELFVTGLEEIPHSFTLDSLVQAHAFNNSRHNDKHYFVISFTDRPNTGKQPVGDDVVVDAVNENGHEIGRINDWSLGLLSGRSVKSWKPNHAAMLKQWQAEQAKDGKTMGDFERQERYYVIKLTDAEAALPDDEHRKLTHIMNTVSNHRESVVGKEPLVCAVIESDWPEYEKVWEMIEKRMSIVPDGKPVFTQAMADAGVLLDVGVVFTTETGGEYTAELINDRCVCFTDEDGFLVAITLGAVKPIQTDEDKTREVVCGEIIDAGLANCTGVNDVIDLMFNSDKFTITLNKDVK